MKLSEASKKLKFTHRSVEKLKWGVAGCGLFAERTFLPSLQMLKKSKLVSVYSSDISRAKFIADKFAAKKAFSNFDEFLKSDINAVYISGRNSDHHWQVIKAAQAGKHILCEKPLALNSLQAAEMVEVCEKNNVFLAVDYVFRFHPLILKAKELIKNELIGKIISISADFNIMLPPGENFRYQKNLSGGGALRDLGTHMIDLLRFFGGEIEQITGFTDNVIFKGEVDDFSAGIAKFKNSGYGRFCVSFNSEKAFNRIEILGYKGSIAIENVIVRKHIPAKLIIDLVGEKKKAFRGRTPKMLLLLKEFQNSILKGEYPKPAGKEGVINMEIMERLEKLNGIN